MTVDVHFDHLVEIVSVECFYSQIIFFPTFHNVLFGRNSLPHTQGIGSYASFFLGWSVNIIYCYFHLPWDLVCLDSRTKHCLLIFNSLQSNL